jgi:hypothetical protein
MAHEPDDERESERWAALQEDAGELAFQGGEGMSPAEWAEYREWLEGE